MIKYFPFPCHDGKHKYYIITNSGKIVKFGAFGMSDFTLTKNEDQRKRYIDRHKKNESKFWNKSGIDTPSFWSRFYLWEKPTKTEAYQYIKNHFLT